MSSILLVLTGDQCSTCMCVHTVCSALPQASPTQQLSLLRMGAASLTLPKLIQASTWCFFFLLVFIALPLLLYLSKLRLLVTCLLAFPV